MNQTDPTADVLVAEARRAVHESLILLPAWEAERVRSLIADLETAVEFRTAASAVVTPPTGRAAVARVRALHQQYTFGDGTTDYCAHCNQIRGGWVPWPCPTVRALDVELAVEAHGTGTQQPETPPAEVEWLVQTRWHDGDWRDWSRRAERTEAEDEYDRARDGKHDWRLVRVTTSYAIEAATEPAPVAQQPAALRGELKPWQLLADQPDEPLPQTERVIGGRRLDATIDPTMCPRCKGDNSEAFELCTRCAAEQQAAAADDEETRSCPAKHGALGRICELPAGHDGMHTGSGPNGGAVWEGDAP